MSAVDVLADGATVAKSMADRQRYYDRLHHEERVEWLHGLERLDGFEVNLLKASNAALADPSGMIAYRSADLEDNERLAELDQFALSRCKGESA